MAEALRASVAAMAVCLQLGQAHAAFPNLTQIYLAAGVRDNGASGSGPATAFNCTNWTTATHRVRFVLRDFNAVVVGDKTFTIGPTYTLTVATKSEGAYALDGVLLPAGKSLNMGSVRIFATAAGITCNAVIVNAAGTNQTGVDLHLLRYNAISGTLE